MVVDRQKAYYGKHYMPSTLIPVLIFYGTWYRKNITDMDEWLRQWMGMWGQVVASLNPDKQTLERAEDTAVPWFPLTLIFKNLNTQ